MVSHLVTRFCFHGGSPNFKSLFLLFLVDRFFLVQGSCLFVGGSRLSISGVVHSPRISRAFLILFSVVPYLSIGRAFLFCKSLLPRWQVAPSSFSDHCFSIYRSWLFLLIILDIGHFHTAEKIEARCKDGRGVYILLARYSSRWIYR